MSVEIKIDMGFNYIVVNSDNRSILAIMTTLKNSIAFCRQHDFEFAFNF